MSIFKKIIFGLTILSLLIPEVVRGSSNNIEKFRISLGFEKVFLSTDSSKWLSVRCRYWARTPSSQTETLYGVEFSYFLNRNLILSLECSYIDEVEFQEIYYNSMYSTVGPISSSSIFSVRGMLNKGIYHPFGLPITPYIGLGMVLRRINHILVPFPEFLDGYEKHFTDKGSPPIGVGYIYFGGVSYEIYHHFSLIVRGGRQHLIVGGQHDFSGMFLDVKVGYTW